MIQEQLNIIDQPIYAYLLVERRTAKILDWNKLAESYYKNSEEFPSIDSLFAPTLDGKSMAKLVQQLDIEGTLSLDNIFSFKVSEETFPCHIELCKIDEEHLLLVIHESGIAQDNEYADVIELVDNPIFVLEPDDNLSFVFKNKRCQQYLTLEHRIFDCETSSFLNILPNEKQEAFLLHLHHDLRDTGECDMDLELTFGREYFQLFHFNVFQSSFNNRLYGVLISVKKQSDLLKKIEYEQQYLDIVQKFTKDLLFRIDVRKRTLVHRGEISGFTDLEPEMRNFPECMRDNRLVHPEDLEGYIAFHYRLMSGLEAKFETRLQLNGAKFEKYRLQGSPIVDTEGNTIQVVGKCENIQKIVDIENKANYDGLTSTLNKQSFKELIDDTMNRAVASDKFAVLFLDLDNFKGINDNLGHVFGDFLLEATAKRMLNCVRNRDRVGRVGGDEFVVFFQFAPSHEAVMERAEAILHSLRRDFTYGDQRCKVKASIGIALFPEHGDSYEDLYHKADLALYKSKERGKDIATIYHPDFGD